MNTNDRDIRNIKQQIWFLYRHPINFFSMQDCLCAEMKNDSCGDEIKVYARIENENIEEMSFEAVGCSLVFASASVAISNFRKSSKLKFIEAFISLQKQINENVYDDRFFLFFNVNVYRKKCVLLPWQAFAKIITSS